MALHALSTSLLLSLLLYVLFPNICTQKDICTLIHTSRNKTYADTEKQLKHSLT